MQKFESVVVNFVDLENRYRKKLTADIGDSVQSVFGCKENNNNSSNERFIRS